MTTNQSVNRSAIPSADIATRSFAPAWARSAVLLTTSSSMRTANTASQKTHAWANKKPWLNSKPSIRNKISFESLNVRHRPPWAESEIRLALFCCKKISTYLLTFKKGAIIFAWHQLGEFQKQFRLDTFRLRKISQKKVTGPLGLYRVSHV